MYIRQFRNIVDQEICFDNRYRVEYDPDQLLPDALRIRHVSVGHDIIHQESELDKVHIIVGKTGSGKTNILQLIGMPEKDRTMKAEQGAAYFLLFKGSDDRFMLEPYDIPLYSGKCREYMTVAEDHLSESKTPSIEATDKEAVSSSSGEAEYGDRLPDEVKEYSRITDSMHILRFGIDEEGKPKDVERLYRSEELGGDLTYIFNGFERQAFPHCPYEEIRMTAIREGSDYWQPRINAEYRRTSPWSSCRILKRYIDSFGDDSIKQKMALVINAQNWADTIKQHINEGLQYSDYWTFVERKREDEIRHFLKKDGGKNKRKRKPVEIRHQFVHDLWTDFALYLREWIEYIQSFPVEIPEDHMDYFETADVYQEYLDYAFEKEQEKEWEEKLL